jgi:16S rRNA (cytosine967-C5)-methyltransferase
MKPSSLYGHLAELLGLVRGHPAPADAIVRRFFREHRYLGPRERRWLSERLFGTVRHLRFLEHIAREELCVHDVQRSPVPPLVLAAAYGIVKAGEESSEVCEAIRERWGTDIPEVPPESVLGGLSARAANAARQPSSAPVLALLHSFPEVAVDEWVGRLGLPDTEHLLTTLNMEAPLSLRVNALKCSVDDCTARLNAEGLDVQPGTLSPSALRLPRRVVLDTVPAFRDGWFEMQDEGSQIVSLLLQAAPGMTVVDACAGGGGKTLHIAALLQNQGTLVAIDPDGRKLQNLRDRARRGGIVLHHVIEARHDDPGLSRFSGIADAVLVDAPCSGLGTVRRSPWLKVQWNDGRNAERRILQQSILAAAASMVKAGGRLVYSTCTLVKSENEEAVERFLQDRQDFQLVPASDILLAQGVSASNRAASLTLWPHDSGSDGFFAAVMVRRTAR